MNKKILLSSLILSMAGLLCGCSAEERLERQGKLETLGIECMERGEYDDAIEAFDSALSECLGRITGREIEINLYKAGAQFMAGDDEGALETYTALIEFEKTDPKPYYLRASVYLKQGENEAAVTDYKAAVALSDADYEMYIRIYENLSDAGLENEGLGFLHAALDLGGKSAESCFERGKIYLMLEQYDLAQDQLITARDKGISDAAVYLAQVYQTTGANESAQQVLEQYIAEGNTSCVAMNVMATLALENENYADALTYINKGLAMEDVQGQQGLMRSKIICQEKTYDFDGAYKTAEAYCELYPKDEEAARELVFLSTRRSGAVDEYYRTKKASEDGSDGDADSDSGEEGSEDDPGEEGAD